MRLYDNDIHIVAADATAQPAVRQYIQIYKYVYIYMGPEAISVCGLKLLHIVAETAQCGAIWWYYSSMRTHT